MVQIKCPPNLKELERAGPADASLLFLGGIVSIVLAEEGGRSKALLVASSLHLRLSWGRSCLLWLLCLAWLGVAPYVSWLVWRLSSNLFKLSLSVSFIV